MDIPNFGMSPAATEDTPSDNSGPSAAGFLGAKAPSAAGFLGTATAEPKAAPKEDTPSEPVTAAVMRAGEKFWNGFTDGGVSKFLKDTLPGQLGERYGDVKDATAQFNANKEWDAERARRSAMGESMSGMENWKLDRINQIVQSKKQEGPTPSFGDIVSATVNAAADDPAGFAGKMLRGLIAHPELALTPEALPARMAGMASAVGKTAAQAAKTGTEAAQLGASAGAESALSQLNERGTVNPTQTGADAAMVAAPMVALRMAADFATTRSAKVRNIDPEPQVTQTAIDAAQANVAKGMPLDQALKDALDAVKVDPDVAAEAAAMLKPHVDEAKAEAAPTVDQPSNVVDLGRIRQNLNLEKRMRADDAEEFKSMADTAQEYISVGRLDASDLQKVYDGKYSSADDLLEAMEGLLRKVEAPNLSQRSTPFSEWPRDADGNLLKDSSGNAITNNFVAANDQAGRIDPKLLAAMGLTGVGAAAGYLFNKDPKEAIAGALATGGVLAAGVLLRKSVTGIGQLADHFADTRYRITHLTDDYHGTIASGQLANMRLAAQVKELVPDPKQREQLTHSLQGDATIPLTPQMQQAATAIRQLFDTMGAKGQKAGVLPDELLPDYVTQLWTGLNKNDGLFRNMVTALGIKNQNGPGMSPTSRFAMERVIPSYKDGMAKGMIPTTLDAAEIMRVYGDNINKAIANKNLIKALERERTPWGEPVMVKDTPAATAQRIAQAAAIADQQFQGGGSIGQAVKDFAISKAPKGFETIDHPQMRGYKVSADIVPVMRNLFDAKPNAVSNAAAAVSIAAKRGLFSYSMFHAKSLLDALGGTGMDAWAKIPEAADALKRGQAGDVLDELVRGGLNVVERPIEGNATPFTNALKLLGEKYPVVGVPAKAARYVQQKMDGMLWGVIHPTFKAAVGMASFEKLIAKGMPRAEAAKAAASYTNDIFGGLDWFKIADGVQNKMGRDLALAVTSPRGRQFMQTMMLAPDWTVATTRAMAKAIPGIAPREIAALHQGYVVRSALMYATIADGLNMAFSGHHFWENQDPTMVDLGDGRRLQLSKHFMEPIHWLTSPAQQAMNKLGYIPKEIGTQALNQKYLSPKGAPPIVEKGASIGSSVEKRAAHALAMAMPITGSVAYESGAVPALSGFFGFPVYGKTEQQSVDAAIQRATEQGKDTFKAETRARKTFQSKQEKRP